MHPYDIRAKYQGTVEKNDVVIKGINRRGEKTGDCPISEMVLFGVKISSRYQEAHEYHRMVNWLQSISIPPVPDDGSPLWTYYTKEIIYDSKSGHCTIYVVEKTPYDLADKICSHASFMMDAPVHIDVHPLDAKRENKFEKIYHSPWGPR